jgi:hypothetical protein
MSGRVATEPNVGRPSTRLDLFYQGATVTDLEEDSIAWNLEPPSDGVVPNRYHIQRRGGPDWMGNELWEGSNQAVLNFPREGEELAPRGFSKVGPATSRGPFNGHAFDAP